MKQTHLPIKETIKNKFRELKFDLQIKFKKQLSDSDTLDILINSFRDFLKLKKSIKAKGEQ